MSLMLVFTFSIPVFAAGGTTTSGSMLLDDQAGLLTSTEAPQVLETLEKKSSESDCNLVVLTTNQGLDESAIQQYASNYYTNNVNNKTQTNFCITLTVDITSRKVDVRTFNPGSKRNLNENASTELREYVTQDLTNGDYAKAFEKFADKGSYMAASINEDGSRNKSSFPWLTRILISLVIGFVIALIICFIIKKQLKSVEMKAGAADYIRPNSLNIANSRDNFLYSNVTKTAKPENNSSSSGYGGGSSGSGSTGSF